MLLLGMPVHASIGANKVANTVSTLSSFLRLFRSRELSIQEIWPILVICGLGGTAGGLAASSFDGETLTFLALCLLIFAFFLSFLGKTDFGDVEKLPFSKRTSSLLFGIGVYDGLFGPGSGTLMLYVMAAKKLQYFKAVLYGRVAIFATCFGAAMIYIITGQILWKETIALMIGSIIGAHVGLHIARKVNANVAKILLRCITVILIGQLALELYLH